VSPVTQNFYESEEHNLRMTKDLEKYQAENTQLCKIFSKRFKRLRDNGGYTLEKIADVLGISRQSVVYYAMGDRLPSIPILIRIAKLLSTSVDHLLGADEPDIALIGWRIRQFRKEKKLTQTELAENLGKSLRIVKKYEKGQIDFSLSAISDIAKVLDVSSADILGYRL